MPLVILAAAAFAAGVVVAGDSSGRDAAARFGEAWEAQDFTAMHDQLTPEARTEYPLEDFERRYRQAQRTATLAGIAVGEPVEAGGGEAVALPLEIRTRSFGTVSDELAVPVSGDGVAWGPELVFPGLEPGESLERRARAPVRAPLLYRDRSPLAEGPAEARVTLGAGSIVVGEIGEAPPKRARQMQLQGFPEGTPAGTSGLELAFDEALAGIPGGRLIAAADGAKRTLARGGPTEGKAIRTTLDPELQEAAVAALGDRFGGIAALDARSGEIRAVAGIAFSAPQPPGSTFKVITTVAALEAGITSLDQRYPVVTATDAGGREIENAYDEPCGGTLVESFADSCNTVFAPIGAELGPDRVRGAAERFGFNSPPQLYYEEGLDATKPPASTIPPLENDLEAAVSAIGQGEVLATPLQLASVAQTIAADGVRSPTPLVKDSELAGEFEPEQVTSPEIAGQVGTMMEEVVRSGTGQPAALPGIKVAGKTGTAELGPKPGQTGLAPGQEPELELDAWFTAYAPAKNPKLAVAVMIVNAEGGGGDVAGPIAREVLAAGL